MSKKIAIIMSSYNREHLIAETLDSIIAQTHTNWKCIIVDDHSKDNVASAVEPYLKKDPRISFYLKSAEYKPGLSETRNYGFDLAKKTNPDFINFFDDDDLMHPRKLELQLQSLQQNLKASFSICGTKNFKDAKEITFNEVKEVWPKTPLSIGESFLTRKNRFVAQVPLFRYEYVKGFRFDEDLYFSEEWALFTQQFLLTKPEFTVLDQVLFYRRKHAGTMTGSQDPAWKKTKSYAIVRLKVFEFLNQREAHTRTTLFYFAQYFLLNHFDKVKLEWIGDQLKSNYSVADYKKFQFAYFVAKNTRKVVARILKY